MGRFDGTVDKVINGISAARNVKRKADASVFQTAENMFGNVGTLIQELEPALAKKFPDQKPEIFLAGWVEKDGVITNSLKLKSTTKQKEIPLAMVIGQSRVSVDGRTIENGSVLDAIGQKIVSFFST
jgi:hypothetical protein